MLNGEDDAEPVDKAIPRSHGSPIPNRRSKISQIPKVTPVIVTKIFHWNLPSINEADTVVPTRDTGRNPKTGNRPAPPNITAAPMPKRRQLVGTTSYVAPRASMRAITEAMTINAATRSGKNPGPGRSSVPRPRIFSTPGGRIDGHCGHQEWKKSW